MFIGASRWPPQIVIRYAAGGRLMPDNSFHRDASGRLTFEMFSVPGDSYQAICNELVAALLLVPLGTPVSDFLSIVFQDYGRGSQVVGLEWDNWSGFIVVAKTPESEPLVHAIATWLLGSTWATISSPADPSAAPGPAGT
jgi:hypothetical protein